MDNYLLNVKAMFNDSSKCLKVAVSTLGKSICNNGKHCEHFQTPVETLALQCYTVLWIFFIGNAGYLFFSCMVMEEHFIPKSLRLVWASKNIFKPTTSSLPRTGFLHFFLYIFYS